MDRSRVDHYVVLGVARDATTVEIRDAYRALARRLHPDRGGATDDRMAAVNEAYRVLGDLGRRAAYDASLRAPTSATGARTAPAASEASFGAAPTRAPGPLTPARVPWRLIGIMFGIGALAVLVLAALARPPTVPPPDNLIDVGSCVVVEPNQDAREVTCPHPGVVGEVRVVRALVASAPECPAGTAAHRDRQGRGIACLEPPGATLPER